MTMKRRIDRLEGKRGGGRSEPFVVLYRIMRLGDERNRPVVTACPG